MYIFVTHTYCVPLSNPHMNGWKPRDKEYTIFACWLVWVCGAATPCCCMGCCCTCGIFITVPCCIDIVMGYCCMGIYCTGCYAGAADCAAYNMCWGCPPLS